MVPSPKISITNIRIIVDQKLKDPNDPNNITVLYKICFSVVNNSDEPYTFCADARVIRLEKNNQGGKDVWKSRDGDRPNTTPEDVTVPAAKMGLGVMNPAGAFILLDSIPGVKTVCVPAHWGKPNENLGYEVLIGTEKKDIPNVLRRGVDTSKDTTIKKQLKGNPKTIQVGRGKRYSFDYHVGAMVPDLTDFKLNITPEFSQDWEFGIEEKDNKSNSSRIGMYVQSPRESISGEFGSLTLQTITKISDCEDIIHEDVTFEFIVE